MRKVAILGKIEFPIFTKKTNTVYCDGCNQSLIAEFGDPRESLITIHPNGKQEEKKLCPECMSIEWN